MSTKANQEVASMGLSAIRKNTKPQTSPQTPSQTQAPVSDTPNNSTPSNKSENTSDKIDCALCHRVHSKDWPYFAHCNKHHPGGDESCWVLHPERRPRRYGRSQTDSNTTSEQPQTQTNSQASTAALHTRTGLMAINTDFEEVPNTSDDLNQALTEHYLTRDSVIADSGASSHIFNDLKHFITYS